MKRTKPLKRASVVDEQLRVLIEEIRREQAALVDLKCSVLPEIREGFRILRIEALAHPNPVVPVALCEALYEAITKVASTAPFTAAFIVEESKGLTADAKELRQAIDAVLPGPIEDVDTRKLSIFLLNDAARVAGRWRLDLVKYHTNKGSIFRVYRASDEK